MSNTDIQVAILLESMREQTITEVCEMFDREEEKSKVNGDLITAEIYAMMRAKVRAKLRTPAL